MSRLLVHMHWIVHADIPHAYRDVTEIDQTIIYIFSNDGG
jgi:hypothetical protein